MTQAFNLAQFANNLNSSGQAAAGTSLSGAVPVANGGTNLTTVPTNGQLLIGNGTGYAQAALTAGSNITITNGAGTISIAATATAPAPSTTDVLNATAGATAGAVGTYALLGNSLANNTAFTAGTTYAGSGLRYAGFGKGQWGFSQVGQGVAYAGTTGTLPATPSGTWRAMGTSLLTVSTCCGPGSNVANATIFLRIS